MTADYYVASAVGLSAAPKKVFAKTLFQPITQAINVSGTNQYVRAYGLSFNNASTSSTSVWRFFVHPTAAANTYAIGWVNATIGSSQDIAASTFVSTNYFNTTHYLSVALDISTAGTNKGSAVVTLDGSSYTLLLSPFSTTKGITDIGLLNSGRTVTGTVGGQSTGSVRFDDFSYSVPEPSGVAVLAMACSTFFLRRRAAGR